jgi:hypothetical protein
MKTDRIIKIIILLIVLTVCCIFSGCFRGYIERSDTRLRDYREHELRPAKQKVNTTDEYWWNDRWNPMPNMGSNPGGISYIPRSVNTSK